MLEIDRVLSNGDHDVYDVLHCDLKKAIYLLSYDFAAGVIKKITITDLNQYEGGLELEPL